MSGGQKPFSWKPIIKEWELKWDEKRRELFMRKTTLTRWEYWRGRWRIFLGYCPVCRGENVLDCRFCWRMPQPRPMMEVEERDKWRKAWNERPDTA